jgi:hypothetical protein
VTAVTAARTTLPLSLVGAGKTVAFEEFRFGNVADHMIDHLKSG